MALIFFCKTTTEQKKNVSTTDRMCGFQTKKCCNCSYNVFDGLCIINKFSLRMSQTLQPVVLCETLSTKLYSTIDVFLH